jgi:hypothetical protein
VPPFCSITLKKTFEKIKRFYDIETAEHNSTQQMSKDVYMLKEANSNAFNHLSL